MIYYARARASVGERAHHVRVWAHMRVHVCARVGGREARQRTGKEGKKGRKRRRKPIRGRKQEGILKKARPGKNFSEKILWIENLSLCLQCLNIAAKV